VSNLENEEMLTGGNVTNVYRSGDTVRRELKPDSTKIHKILKHWENKYFSYAPKLLMKKEHLLREKLVMIL